MEELLAFLIQLFGELILQVVFDLALDTFTSAGELDLSKWKPAVAWLGLFVVGGVVGGVTAFYWPERLIRFGPTTGLSLFLSPLGTGLVMQQWGRYRRAKGSKASIVSTFGGGAAFGLGVALLRFLGTR